MPGMDVDSGMIMDDDHTASITNLAQMTLIQQIQLIDLLFKYFEGSEWKGTLSNISKDAFVMDTADNEQGWIALKDLVKFKRISALTRDPSQVLSCIHSHASQVFEISPDSSQIRPLVAFDSKSLEKEAILRSIVSSQLVHVSGFPQGTSAEEVKSYMATYGTVVNVVKDVQASEEWDVEFIQTQDLIKVLSVSHVYEDSILQVTAKTSSVNVPDLTAVFQPKQPTTTSSGTPFSRNRILQFKLSKETEVSKAQIKNLFESYSTVVSVDFEKDARIGYVKFKRSVASQILPLITNNGGLFFQEEPISVRVLEGNEETLYWDVSAEKERLNPVPVVHPDPVPSKRLRKIQARKAKQLTRQRGKRVPLGISASLRGGVDTVNAFGKRTRSTTAASPSPETNGKESDKRKLAALRASRKKVKVDPLDSLFQFFSVE